MRQRALELAACAKAFFPHDRALRMEREGSDSPARAPTMDLGVDGTGVPVRKSETAGRDGKQPDGSAKTRKVKPGTVWTADRTPSARF